MYFDIAFARVCKRRLDMEPMAVLKESFFPAVPMIHASSSCAQLYICPTGGHTQIEVSEIRQEFYTLDIGRRVSGSRVESESRARLRTLLIGTTLFIYSSTLDSFVSFRLTMHAILFDFGTNE